MLVLLFYLHRHGLASTGRDPSTHPKAVSRYSWTTIHYTWPSPCFSLIFKVKLSSKFLRTEARLAIGLIALVILIIMATTSNRWAMHRLKKNWKRLHRQCTYVVSRRSCILCSIWRQGRSICVCILAEFVPDSADSTCQEEVDASPFVLPCQHWYLKMK